MSSVLVTETDSVKMLSQKAFACSRGARDEIPHSRFQIQLRGLTFVIDVCALTTDLWDGDPQCVDLDVSCTPKWLS